ncbi:lamin tail domain-containing protein [Cecembia calidifontis]|uniref:Lamin tail-like protein n=1 Tax=Cecembia calidifontis TaxID=1187080 RepID=A0A4Q7P790_9BACT|nr:lamin tail domain-containing protein [Cecembia calidifontis]RZS95914.1 lamin tail-like protein [Cecembia calidifontis]
MFGVFLKRIVIAAAFLGLFFENGLFAQIQDFESNFRIVDHPQEFLPDWSANEVRSTAARVFQANSEGRFGSRALGVQPISSFTGQIYTHFHPQDYIAPKIAFFAKTRQNGSGSRPAMLSISFSKSGFDQWEYTLPVGDASSFPNQNTEYRLFEIPVPQAFREEEKVFVKIQVLYGPGTGSAARFFMDDFGIYNGDEVVDPIITRSAYLLDPYRLALHLDKAILQPVKSQVRISGFSNFELLFPADTLLVLESIDPFPKGSFPIHLENLRDKNGTVTPLTTAVMDNSYIEIGETLFIRPDQLLVSFSHEFLESSVTQTSNFLLGNQNPIAIETLENRFQAILTFRNPFNLNSFLVLEARGIQNKDQIGREGMLRRSFAYRDFIEDLFLIEQDIIDILHELDIDPSSISAPSFKIEDFEEVSFEVLLPSPARIQLIARLPFEEGPVFSLLIPHRKSSRGFPIHASKRDFFWDRTAPELVQVLPVDRNKVLAVFSEALDPAFMLVSSNFSIGQRNPNQILLQNNNSQALLSFPISFENGQQYTLTIQRAVDITGNSAENLSFSFVFDLGQRIGFKEIVINEVMPAPRAGNPIPNVEYVELYNTTDKSIYLGGMQLANSRRNTTLPSAVLGPKSYLILCPRARISDLAPFGEVLGLTNWPTLLNSSDQVKLLDSQGEVLDSLNYTTASFGGSAFAQGGFSLEIANPYLSCYLPSNLKASQHEKRGTPGKKNSVYESSPDLSKPRFIRSSWLGNRQVLFTFSKILNPNTHSLSVEISPTIEIARIATGSSPDQLWIEFKEELKEGIRYILKFKNLRDCIGNLLDEDAFVWMVRPSTASAGDIVINEVLFNARVNAPKFVEIYNHSDKFINLKDWKLANFNSSQEIANRRILFADDFIIEPFSFLVFTTDAEKLHQEYPKGDRSRFVAYSSLPSYPISSGNVVLLNPEENIREIFSYHERMHHPLLRERRGVSLERLSPFKPVDAPNNWQSASASSGFATPGIRNSQIFESQEGIGISISPKVFAPDIPGQPAFVTIGYKMEAPGKTANIRIYAVNGSLIREICQNAVLGEEGFFLWDGTDLQGRKVRPGHYIVWAEIYDLDGTIKRIKNTAVVGTNF